MSDLAPFVAAAIESRVVTELQEENQRLRTEIAETRAAALESARFGGCIQITGDGGGGAGGYSGDGGAGAVWRTI